MGGYEVAAALVVPSSQRPALGVVRGTDIGSGGGYNVGVQNVNGVVNSLNHVALAVARRA